MSSSKDFHHGTKKSVRSFCEISSAETMGIIIHFWHLMEASISKNPIWLVMFFFFFQEIAGSYLTPETSQNMEATCFAIPATERISGPKVMVSEDYTWTMERITQWVSIFHLAIFQLFSSVLNVIGGDFTIQSNHYYYCCNCSFWNAFRTLSSYLTQIYCIFNCGIK